MAEPESGQEALDLLGQGEGASTLKMFFTRNEILTRSKLQGVNQFFWGQG